MKNSKNLTIISLAFSLGLILSALILGDAIKKFQTTNRYVTVRGLYEKPVKSNLVVWQLNFKTTGNQLSDTQSSLDKQKNAVIDFLTKSGFKRENIQPQGIRVIDKRANEYDNHIDNSKRYILLTSVKLRSEQVDLAMKAQQELSNLIKANVTLTDLGECGNMPQYLFTKLNDIKIDMLEKATKNAYDAAQQFADNAQSKVGSIKRATQGYFSIKGLDAVEGNTHSGTYCGSSESVMKNIRVVTTIDYFLN